MFGADTQYKPYSAEIEFRKMESGVRLPQRSYLEVSNLGCLVVSKTADCAALISPVFKTLDSANFLIGDITKFKDLATAEEFEGNVVRVM